MFLKTWQLMSVEERPIMGLSLNYLMGLLFQTIYYSTICINFSTVIRVPIHQGLAWTVQDSRALCPRKCLELNFIRD